MKDEEIKECALDLADHFPSCLSLKDVIQVVAAFATIILSKAAEQIEKKM